MSSLQKPEKIMEIRMIKKTGKLQGGHLTLWSQYVLHLYIAFARGARKEELDVRKELILRKRTNPI